MSRASKTAGEMAPHQEDLPEPSKTPSVDQVFSPQRLEDLIGYNIRRTSALIMSEFTASFADVAIRPVQFSALALIGEKPGVTSSELCRQLGMQRANIVALLADLDKRGFIKRDDDKSDRRLQLLKLTRCGQDLLQELWVRVRAYEETLFLSLSSQERNVMLKLLRKIWVD